MFIISSFILSQMFNIRLWDLFSDGDKMILQFLAPYEISSCFWFHKLIKYNLINFKVSNINI